MSMACCGSRSRSTATTAMACGRCAPATGVRIGGGEMARTFEDLRLALEADALDVYQPDVVLALGISSARTFAELALRRNRWFTPAHVDERDRSARQPPRVRRRGRRTVSRIPLRPAGMDARAPRLHARRARRGSTPTACVRVPDAPGLGLELDEEAIAFYAGGGARRSRHDSAEIKRVGFIGLGNMGGPMCGHLARAGFEVTAYDLDGGSARAGGRRRRAGGVLVGRLRRRRRDAVITMLPGAAPCRAGAAARRRDRGDGAGLGRRST